MKVILIENYKLTAIALAKMLNFELGYDVIFLTDKIELLLKEIKEKKPDIILLDAFYLEKKEIKKLKHFFPK